MQNENNLTTTTTDAADAEPATTSVVCVKKFLIKILFFLLSRLKSIHLMDVQHNQPHQID